MMLADALDCPSMSERRRGAALCELESTPILTKLAIYFRCARLTKHLFDGPRTDDEELPNLIPAFRAVGRAQAAGLFLLSPDSAIADVWLPGARGPERASRISVVG